jgi:hypothetical protein
MDSVNNVRNLSYFAASQALGDSEDRDTDQVFEPRNHYFPKTVNVGASMMITPEVFRVDGYIGTDKKTEYYPVKDYGPESARFDFQQKYMSAGVRGVTVKPLYDFGRYA